MELLTYTEAAELTGLTNKTIQRHVKKGALEVVETPLGKRIPRSALDSYLGLRRDSEGQGLEDPHEDTETLQGHVFEEVEDVPGTAKDSPGQAVHDGPYEGASVPLSAHLAALDLAKTQLEFLQRQSEESQRVAMQAERAKYSLEAQLAQYQRVLAESAESLAEERAMRLVAEAKAAEVPVSPSNDLVVPALPVDQAPPVLLDTPTRRRGWGSRLKGWLLGEKTG